MGLVGAGGQAFGCRRRPGSLQRRTEDLYLGGGQFERAERRSEPLLQSSVAFLVVF